MTIETQDDVVALQHIGRIVSLVLQRMLDAAEPGMSTRELDSIGARLLEQHGARSAPQLAYNFPGATCISINEEAAHGIPGDRVIRAGDVLNVDVSAELDGYFADTGGTTVVPPTTAVKTRLCHATRTALAEAMKAARAGQPINGIGAAIERTAKAYGFKVIENLGSHGVGRSLHEEPGELSTWPDPSEKRIMTDGLVFTVEPFLSLGATWAEGGDDAWTLYADPQAPTVQYEHTVVATRNGPIILTLAA